jgi:rare lipoprotein A
MFAMTCAHRDYPFGTRLRVTNMQNDLSAECIVNDRGPFVDGRDIDLSYAVAKKIGVIGSGVARVMLEQNGRDDSYVQQAKVQTSDLRGPFAIQVGAFTDNINAIRLTVSLKLK